MTGKPVKRAHDEGYILPSRCLQISKLDYGSIIYGSVGVSCLKLFDPIRVFIKERCLRQDLSTQLACRCWWTSSLWYLKLLLPFHLKAHPKIPIRPLSFLSVVPCMLFIGGSRNHLQAARADHIQVKPFNLLPASPWTTPVPCSSDLL